MKWQLESWILDREPGKVPWEGDLNKDLKKWGEHSRQGAASAELLGSVPAVFKKEQGQNSSNCPVKMDRFF